MDEKTPALNRLGKIAQYFIDNFQMTILVVITIIVIGMTSLISLPKESLPEIVFPALIVQVPYPGSSAEDIEQLIIDPIESEIAGLEDLDSYTSTASQGVAFLSISFNETVDIQKKEIEVDSLLASIDLPADVETPDAAIFSSSELPLLNFTISGPYQLATLTDIAKQINDEVKKLSGVDDVSFVGGSEEEIQVKLQPGKLETLNLSMDDITRALQQTSISFPLGEVAMGNRLVPLRLDSRLHTLHDIENLLIRGSAGQQVFLKDVAEVRMATIEQKTQNSSYYRVNGLYNDSIFVTVTRQVGADVIATSQRIQQYLIDNKGRTYPADIAIGIAYDSADYVTRDLSNIQLSAVSGLLVVILVLFLFIGLKESLIVSLTIPLSLLMTFAALSYVDISLNTFAILGLIVSLGLLVDNSIIVMENMDRLNRMGYSPLKAALVGSNQVALPILASTLTTVAAFFPLAILPGIFGAFINTIPRTIIIALISSLIVSITVTPSLYAFILKRIQPRQLTARRRQFNNIVAVGFVMVLSYAAFYDKEAALWLPFGAVIFFTSFALLRLFLMKDRTLEDSKLVRLYQRFLSAVLRRTWRKVALLISGFVLLIASIWLIPSGVLKVNFFPAEEPASLAIDIALPSGIHLADTIRITKQVEAQLIENPSIDSFNTTMGSNGQDHARIEVTFVDKTERELSGNALVAQIDDKLKRIAGATITVSVSNRGGPPTGLPIGYKFIAEDYAAGQVVAEQYKHVIEAIPGVFNTSLSVQPANNATRMTINRNKASYYGLTVSQIATQLNRQINGSVPITVKRNQEYIDVRVIGEAVRPLQLEEVAAFYIKLPNAEKIPLGALVDFEQVKSVSAINHEDGRRVIAVNADIREGYNASEINRQIEQKTADIELPRGVSRRVSGDAQSIQESFSDLLRSMLLAILLVFIILTVQFKSVAQPFVILTTVPMAMIGVLSGLVITGNQFGFYAFMALVALVGIAVNDAIVLIDFMNGLRREGLDLGAAILEATKTRFNPVLATTLTTIGGVLPLAFRDRYYAQFSYSLIFGLLVTTLLTLVIIPIVYYLIETVKWRIMRKGEERL